MVGNLARLLDNGKGTHHNVEFLVGSNIICIHNGILVAQFEYFVTMLGSGIAKGAGDGHPEPLQILDTMVVAVHTVL